MAPQQRVVLSLRVESSGDKVGPTGAHGLLDALGPDSDNDRVVSRASMHGTVRSGPGIPQSMPPQWPDRPLACANARSPRDAADADAEGGNVPQQNERAAADVAVSGPFIKPAWIEQWHRHLDHYRAVVSETTRTEVAALSLSDQQALVQIKEGITELEAMLPLLDGRAPPLGEDFSLQQFRLLAKYVLKDARLRQRVQDLTLKRPDLVTSRLTNFSQLVFSANGMRKTIGGDSRQFGSRVPGLNDYLRQVDREIKSALHEAGTQSDVQVEILELVRDASQGFADADLQDRNAGLGGWITRWMLSGGSASGLADQIRHELLESFGRWFSVHSVGGDQIRISLRPDVVGRESCVDLVQALEQMSLTLQSHRDRAAVRAAIVASQDVHWILHGGGERLALTPSAVERLGVGGSCGLLAVPQARLRAGLVAAAKGVELGVLKVSLMDSFRAEVNRLVDRASCKAELMHGLMRDLMDSPSVEGMLELVDAAARHHRHLWQLRWGGCSGGTTEELLQDIRSCIQRHAEPAPLPVPLAVVRREGSSCRGR